MILGRIVGRVVWAHLPARASVEPVGTGYYFANRAMEGGACVQAVDTPGGKNCPSRVEVSCHGSWQMSAEGRAAVKRGRNSRGQDEEEDGDDDDEPMGPISPSVRRNARRGR